MCLHGACAYFFFMMLEAFLIVTALEHMRLGQNESAADTLNSFRCSRDERMRRESR